MALALPGAVAARAVDMIMKCVLFDCMVAGRRLTMDVRHGWFSDNKEWIEYIAAAVVLWLLMMAVIAGFDLRSAG
jgi:hypothetical protein